MAVARQTFTANGTFTAPAGVYFVKLIYTQNYSAYAFGPQNLSFISTDGFLYNCGFNANGEVGDGATVTSKTSPTPVAGSQNLQMLQGGQTIIGQTNLTTSSGMFNAILSGNGDLYMFGLNTSGVLGINSVAAVSSPTLVVGGLKFLSQGPIKLPNGSNPFSVFLTYNGAAYSVGDNTAGQLGDGTRTARSSPVAVVGGLTFRQALAGVNNNTPSSNSYFLTTAGAAYACGSNTRGQLGDGTTSAKSSPVAVAGGLVFTALYPNLDQETCYGITAAGALYAWGDNASGQIGDNTVVAKSSPVAVLGGLAFTQVALMGRAVLAMTSNGTVYAWGNGTGGQLGNGSNNSLSSPVAVLGGLTFTQIFAGYQGVSSSNAFGLAGGTLYGWGRNEHGQVGDNTSTGRSSPVVVVGSIAFANVIPTGTCTSGITALGQIYSWGQNISGALGTGNGTDISSPVAIAGGHTVALQTAQLIKELTVVPGTAYAVTVGATTLGFFGATPLGPMTTSVIVQYEQ